MENPSELSFVLNLEYVFLTATFNVSILSGQREVKPIFPLHFPPF